MHTTNYTQTFISVAEDCPIGGAEAPPEKNPKTAAQIQFAMVFDNPYKYDSDDVMFMSNGDRRGIPRQEFFSKGQPCFRSSPLTKRYGWGVHSDENGKIALYAQGSDDYNRLAADTTLKQVFALRSTRKKA